jgi:citrate lyase subunit beta/citryl-CoA lyase
MQLPHGPGFVLGSQSAKKEPVRPMTMTQAVLPRARRSALFLPASNARALAKARTIPCDVVILDLEDAVAPEAKADARAAAVAAIRAGGFGRRELVVRANAADSDWGAADLAALRAAAPDAVLLPKVSRADDIVAAAEALGGAVPVWAMVETMRAVLEIATIAAAPGLAALVMGPNDLAREMGARPGPGRAPLLGFLAMTVAAARAHGLAVLDGVYNDFSDEAGLVRECAQGVEFGFDGKTLIHPSQVAPCNIAFSPDADAIGRAERIVAAFAEPAAAGKGVIQVDGQMVERLHLDGARRILAVAHALG